MIDVQVAPPRPLGEGTAPGQHRPKHTLPVGLVRRHLKDTLALRLRLCHLLQYWMSAFVALPLEDEARQCERSPWRPDSAAGFELPCLLPFLQPQTHDITSATGTPSRCQRDRNATRQSASRASATSR